MVAISTRMFLAAAAVLGVLLGTDGLTADQNVKVPPGDELLIVDPNRDSRNLPTPDFVPDGRGNQRIEIPPTVIIHRYYYSGDREFQGPMLPGGTTVLVANHPRTGEQVSLHATLMPGAPRIRYCSTGITYNYGDRCITLDFGTLSSCEPHIVYHRDDPVTAGVKQKSNAARDTTRSFITATGLPQAAGEMKKRGQDSVLAAGQRINTAGTAVFGRALSFWDSTPAGSLSKPSAPFNKPEFSLGDRAGITKELEDTVQTNR